MRQLSSVAGSSALRTTPPGHTAAERVLPPSSPTAGSIPLGGSLHDSNALRATTRNYAHRHRWGFFSLLRGSSWSASVRGLPGRPSVRHLDATETAGRFTLFLPSSAALSRD